MIRKLACAVTAALALGSIAVVAGPATAAKAKPTITATGSVSCAITGKVKISPALTSTNTVPSTTSAKVKGNCTGTTQSGVTPSKLKATVVSTGAEAGTCTGLLEPGSTPFTANISWKASGGKINPTSIVFPNVTPNLPPATIGFSLNNGDTSGSYAGTDNADATANIDPAGLDFGLCDPTPKPNGKLKKAKGIKKLTITGGSLAIT